ncbi:hypothetical protein [uncultured Metabacillus sp.]|uniref:hypothetical protein n=1 Tax=uncultured Metabacillus sp. TaxID=2860135 RepID=UPI00260CE625|nr:hypothetical protein [uncultured Metabacillus sp.]
MTKKLSISKLKDEAKVFDEFVEIDVDVNGEEYTVKMYPYFKPEKIRDLVNELTEFFQKAKEEKLEIPKIEEDDLIAFFICKHFTDIKFTTSKKVKKIYEEFKLLINSSLFKVLSKSFPQESVAQVFDRIFEIIETNAVLENKFKQTQEIIKNLPLENKDVLFKQNKQIPEV